MHRTFGPFLAPILGLVFIGLLAFRCGDPDTDSSEADEWEIQKGALQLKENLRVSEGEDLYFASIQDVEVDNSGRIYVADWKANHVKILSPDGELLDSLGGPGQGPGQFGMLSQILLARGDSLYALDARSGRISVFSPTQEYQYSFTARSSSGSAKGLMVPRTQKGFIARFDPAPRRIVTAGAQTAVRVVKSNGTIKDTLFTTRPYQMAAKKRGQRWTYSTLPYARNSYFALGPNDHIYHVWSGSLKVHRYDLKGTKTHSADLPFSSMSVTDADIERVTERRPRLRAYVREKIPETKPAFDHFLVDDEGRYWFGRPTTNSDSTAWWVTMSDEERVMTETLPSEVEILTVKKDRAYGRTTTEMGAPALVRYNIDR